MSDGRLNVIHVRTLFESHLSTEKKRRKIVYLLGFWSFVFV